MVEGAWQLRISSAENQTRVLSHRDLLFGTIVVWMQLETIFPELSMVAQAKR